MAYWMKWDWEHQCDFCKKRKQCLNKPQLKNSIKKIKKIFDNDPATTHSTLTIECDDFSVDRKKFEEFNN